MGSQPPRRPPLAEKVLSQLGSVALMLVRLLQLCERLLLPGVHCEPPLGDAGICQQAAPSGRSGSASKLNGKSMLFHAIISGID